MRHSRIELTVDYHTDPVLLDVAGWSGYCRTSHPARATPRPGLPQAPGNAPLQDDYFPSCFTTCMTSSPTILSMRTALVWLAALLVRAVHPQSLWESPTLPAMQLS